MNYLEEAESRLGRPVGVLISLMRRDDGIWEMRVLPEHEGKHEDVFFIKRPSFWKRFKERVMG